MAHMGGRPGPTLTKEIELSSPYGLLRTTYGDIANGTKGEIVSGIRGGPLQVKFPDIPAPVAVPTHWAKTIVR